MPAIVSDAGPLHYLILIEGIDVLPQIFGGILIPEIVADELTRPRTPERVRARIRAAPDWFEHDPDPTKLAVAPLPRGAGERATIALAVSIGAAFLPIDDRVGTAAARARGLETIGTLGILVRASQRGFVDLPTAFARRRKTNFRCRPELFGARLAQHRRS